MTEQEWLIGANTQMMLRYLYGFVSDRKLRLFACACCWQIWDMTDSRSRLVVEVAERYADGLAGIDELVSARKAATDIPWHLSRVAVVSVTETNGKKAAIHASENADWEDGRRKQAHILWDCIGNPFQTVTFQGQWKTRLALQVAQSIYDNRSFEDMPILGDALEESGCTNEDILSHCRNGKDHVRGCWVVDKILGKK